MSKKDKKMGKKEVTMENGKVYEPHYLYDGSNEGHNDGQKAEGTVKEKSSLVFFHKEEGAEESNAKEEEEVVFAFKK